MNTRFSLFYSFFVGLIVASLLVVFYSTDRAYRGAQMTSDSDGTPGKVTTTIASGQAVSSDISEDGSPADRSVDDPVRSNRFAQQLLDGFAEATVVETVESLEGDDILLKKEILATEMKYPLITREIRYRFDAEQDSWVPVEGKAYVSDQVIVSLKEPNDALALNGILDGIDAEIVQSLESGSTYLLRFRNRSIERYENMLRTLRLAASLEFAEPNYLKFPAFVPNDIYFGEMWGLNNSGNTGGVADADIDAVEAWDITRGSPAVVVAVVDTGVDITHPDLQQNIYFNPNEVLDGIDNDGNGLVDDINGWNFTASGNGNAQVNDTSDSHGTHVAGTIAATGSNQMGVTGVAPLVKILPVKVLSDYGGFISDYVRGLDYVVSMGAKIVNISLGGPTYSRAEENAIARLEAAGVLVVVASGNDGYDLGFYEDYPTNFPNENILAVLATNSRDQFATYSNYGYHVDVGAPGSDILSTIAGGVYEYYSGTSMAAPHVAGVASLVQSVNPGLNAVQIKSAIMSTVDPLPSLTGLCISGGRVNAFNAVLASAGSLFVPSGSQVSIKSMANDQWVTPLASNSHVLMASASSVGANQLYYVTITEDGDYALRAFSNGLYVTVEQGEFAPLAATRSSIGARERFTPVDQGFGVLAFEANANGLYVSAEDAGRSPLVANRASPALWEQFRVEPYLPLTPGTQAVMRWTGNDNLVAIDATGFVQTGKTENTNNAIFNVGITVDGYITLQSAVSGFFVTAENLGRDPLIANRVSVGNWEQFIALYHGPNQIKLMARANEKYVQVDGFGRLVASSSDLNNAAVFSFTTY
jgi:subtilisin family serine protease